MEEIKGNGTEKKHGGDQPSIADTQEVIRGLNLINLGHNTRPEFTARHTQMVDATRPEHAEGVKVTRETAKELEEKQTVWDDF